MLRLVHTTSRMHLASRSLLRRLYMPVSRLGRSALVILATALPHEAYAQGQSVYDVSIRALATRRELTGLADSLDRELARSGTSGRRRRSVQADLETQRQRLSIGDVAPGDRILLRVFNESSRPDSLTLRPDTVVVSPETTVHVPGLPAISMRGVLHSEVESHLRNQIQSVIRNARVSAVPLVSIGILGAVTRPGYFFVPITASVTEALMVAGGPMGDANPNSLVLQRGGRDRWNRATMTAAAQGQVSLASLGAEPGDVLIVAKSSVPLDRTSTISMLAFVLQSVLIVTQLRN